MGKYGFIPGPEEEPKKEHTPSKPGDHDERGRFAKGNKAAVGRPAPRRELTMAFLGAVTRQEVIDLARKLLEDAMEGNMQAAKMLLDRLLGPVLQQEDLGTQISVTFVRPEMSNGDKGDAV